MMSGVFISYSREDVAFAKRLYAALAEAGQDVWLDAEDLPSGMHWLTGVERAIERADVLAFVISPDSLMSERCMQEIEYASAQRKRIIPVIRREPQRSSIPDGLARKNWIFAREEDDFDGSIRELISCI